MQAPEVIRALFVDARSGSDAFDGTTPESALKSIRNAAALATHHTAIYVANGTYTNVGFGSGSTGNYAAVAFADLTDILVSNLPGHAPRIEFDGSAGISARNMTRFEVRGLDVSGPNRRITLEEAMADRLLHSRYFSGRGIVVWSGTHIRIHNNIVHHAPVCRQ